ncbi:hypothetical protein HY310_02090 [Candidatus Microgenomates bacterium]|nr:hypothetical protein [Candidatus Microgenomates bacterium]
MNFKIKIFGVISFFILLTAVVAASVYFGVKKNQDVRSRATAAGKMGCSNTCSGDPSNSCAGNTCKIDTQSGYYDCTGGDCRSVTVTGMPQTMNAWGVPNPTYNQPVTCVARDSTKADCTCEASAGKNYCWLSLESLVKNVDMQGHRWKMYTYDKDGKPVAGGYVLYDDNNTKQNRWGNSFFNGTDGVQNCNVKKEYREEGDIYSQGSWVETGQVIYTTAAGPGCALACNETCDASHACPSNLTCDTTSGKCRNPACLAQTSCSCVVPVAACQKVAANKELTKIKVGDTVTFTGFGTLTNPATGDSIDKIEFTILKDGVTAVTQEVNTTLDSAGMWKAVFDYNIISAGTYTVKIRVHWLSKNVWLT